MLCSWYRYTAFVDEAEGLDKLEQLQTHNNEEVYKKAVHILETYFGLDDDECVLPPPSIACAMHALCLIRWLRVLMLFAILSAGTSRLRRRRRSKVSSSKASNPLGRLEATSLDRKDNHLPRPTDEIGPS